MANTYSQLSIHCVFAVKSRECLIVEPWRQELYKYIAGILSEKGAKCLAVGGWKDHVHIFLGLPVTIAVSDLMNGVKSSSSKWINHRQFINDKFNWQAGYAAFS